MTCRYRIFGLKTKAATERKPAGLLAVDQKTQLKQIVAGKPEGADRNDGSSQSFSPEKVILDPGEQKQMLRRQPNRPKVTIMGDRVIEGPACNIQVSHAVVVKIDGSSEITKNDSCPAEETHE